MKIMDLGEGCHQVGKMAKEWQKRYKKKKNPSQLVNQTQRQTTGSGQKRNGFGYVKKKTQKIMLYK